MRGLGEKWRARPDEKLTHKELAQLRTSGKGLHTHEKGSRTHSLLFLGRLGPVRDSVERTSPQVMGRQRKSVASNLRIAIVQMKSLDHDIDGNLKQATTYADTAAAAGRAIRFVSGVHGDGLLSFPSTHGNRPETVSGQKNGAVAEINFPTDFTFWLGASFLEASGGGFFTTHSC